MSAPATMAARVERYLRQRRQAGFGLKIEGGQLSRFARFADQAGHQGPLTSPLRACASSLDAAHFLG